MYRFPCYRLQGRLGRSPFGRFLSNQNASRRFFSTAQAETPSPLAGLSLSGNTIPISLGAFGAGCLALSLTLPGGVKPKPKLPVKLPIPMERMSDDKFEYTDNMAVLFLDSEDDIPKFEKEIIVLKHIIKDQLKLDKTRIFYAVRKPGDPRPPAVSKVTGGKGEPLSVVLIKGMRRALVAIEAMSTKEAVLSMNEKELTEFFEDKSEDAERVAEVNAMKPVKHVTGGSFIKEVVEAGTEESPVVLQYFEESCFLCFLMRPVINSIQKMLERDKIPLTIKRLDVEKNDFPAGAPTYRATPCFVLFAGKKTKSQKDGRELLGDLWSEFKPRDFIEKLSKVVPLSEEFKKEAGELADMVPFRLQKCMELAKLLAEMKEFQSGTGDCCAEKSASSSPPVPSGGDPTASSSPVEEPSEGLLDVFLREAIDQVMEEDVLRSDCLMENLEFLDKELLSAEQDILLLALQRANAVIDAEKAVAPPSPPPELAAGAGAGGALGSDTATEGCFVRGSFGGVRLPCAPL